MQQQFLLTYLKICFASFSRFSSFCFPTNFLSFRSSASITFIISFSSEVFTFLKTLKRSTSPWRHLAKSQSESSQIVMGWSLMSGMSSSWSSTFRMISFVRQTIACAAPRFISSSSTVASEYNSNKKSFVSLIFWPF